MFKHSAGMSTEQSDDYWRGFHDGSKDATAALLNAFGAGGVAVTRVMLDAAQSSYTKGYEYGLTDADMRKAIGAALRNLAVTRKRNRQSTNVGEQRDV